jgi:hypothetical protein
LQWNSYKEHIGYATPTVTATLTLKQADEQYTIGSLPVFKLSPAKLDEQFQVQFIEDIPNVTVIGPPEQIALIKKETGKQVSAWIRIDRNATPGVPKPEKLEFKLPQGVRLSEDTQKRADSWSYTLVERK